MNRKERRTETGVKVEVGFNAVVVAVTRETPRILILPGTDREISCGVRLDALPFGPFQSQLHRTLEIGLCDSVQLQTGLALGYVEQLYTFGDRFRDLKELKSGLRKVSVAYLALVRERRLPDSTQAVWQDYYAYLPWEDWREGRPPLIRREIVPALIRWSDFASHRTVSRRRRERTAIAFGLEGASWDAERVLERYELLYEAGLVSEARRDLEQLRSAGISAGSAEAFDAPRISQERPLALDYRRMLATALGRLRGKLRYRPVVFELLPRNFTLFQLQRVVEALAGVRLHKQNFRRLVDRGGLVERTGRFDTRTGGRPAELFRFRREVLRERTAPGVGLPGSGGGPP